MPSRRWALAPARRPVLALCVAALASACADERDGRAEAAERARQMRDVARMLDAMEAPPALGVPGPPEPARSAVALATPPAPTVRGDRSFRLRSWAIGATLLTTLAGGATWWWRHRKRRHALPPAASIASRFAAAANAAAPVTEDPTIARPTSPPDWAYKATAFETPTLQLTLEPVDLLRRCPGGTPPPTGTSLLEQLHAPGTPAHLYLSGDREHPTIRHVGDDDADFARWEAILRGNSHAPTNDGELARWLLPALLRLRAGCLPPDHAAAVLDEATSLCAAGREASSTPERAAWWQAQSLRARLDRLGLGSGASRLLGLRDLGTDACETEAPVLDAWIDVHLAWSGWLIGAACRARLDIADNVCRRLAVHDPVRGAHRHGEVMLHRAGLARGEMRLGYLDDALVLLERAARVLADPSTLLLMADASLQRAAILAPTEAAEACDIALRHAFAAGEHAAWRVASLEMRLAIQVIHDHLPGHAVESDIANALRRELADARSLLHPGTP